MERPSVEMERQTDQTSDSAVAAATNGRCVSLGRYSSRGDFALGRNTGFVLVVRVRLFALAKQRVGRPELEISMPDAATVGDLKHELAALYPELSELLPSVLIAVGTDYASDDFVLTADSQVAAIPPVSRG
jgi:molybdopterin converting factor small subunit